jgi:hypothetical protein
VSSERSDRSDEQRLRGEFDESLRHRGTEALAGARCNDNGGDDHSIVTAIDR